MVLKQLGMTHVSKRMPNFEPAETEAKKFFGLTSAEIGLSLKPAYLVLSKLPADDFQISALAQTK